LPPPRGVGDTEGGSRLGAREESDPAPVQGPPRPPCGQNSSLGEWAGPVLRASRPFRLLQRCLLAASPALTWEAKPCARDGSHPAHGWVPGKPGVASRTLPLLPHLAWHFSTLQTPLGNALASISKGLVPGSITTDKHLWNTCCMPLNSGEKKDGQVGRYPPFHSL
jgi:hypothetical protein